VDTGFFLTAPIAFISTVYVSWRQPTIDELTTDRDAYKEKSEQFGETVLFLFDGILLNLSRRMDVVEASHARLSIYLHIADQNCFIPCGRYSINPVLQKKGRTHIPDNQGCISKAWQNGWHFDNKFPNSQNDCHKYNARIYSIPEATCRSLKMTTRAIAAHRIVDSDNRSLGVIVLESTNNDGLDEANVQQVLQSEVVSLGKMVSDLRSHIPTPQDAGNRGL
jgi:hypothetical protein